jgi:hypothetical protein
MRNAVIALLRAEGRVRHLDASTMASVSSFFAERVDIELSAGARRHPLGFLVVSEPLSGGFILRYHVWPAGWAVPRGQESGQTHDHSYELNSLVLLGSLRQRTFQTVLDMRGNYDVLEVDYTLLGSALRHTGLRARLVGDADETFGAGTAYRLTPATVHRVDAVRPLATLVLVTPTPDTPAPRVFVPCGQNIPGEFSRDRLGAGELAAARAAIRELRERAAPWSHMAPSRA